MSKTTLLLNEPEIGEANYLYLQTPNGDIIGLLTNTRGFVSEITYEYRGKYKMDMSTNIKWNKVSDIKLEMKKGK